MKTAITCLFLATAAFAAEHGNYMYQGSNLPMDHNDDIYNRDFPSLVFNFEQLRRDQPPQVENRQEDLGRYMYRTRTTTTPAAPTTRMLDFPKDIPEIKILPEPIRPLPRLNDASTTLKPFIGQTWNQVINKHLPATIPPPPTTPQWMDLSETLKTNGQRPHHVPVHIPQAPLYHPEAYPQKHETEPLAHPAHPQYSDVMNTEPTYVPTTKAPHEYHMQGMSAEQHVQHAQPRAASHASRGHHKFSWNDVTPTEASPILPTQATVPQPQPQPQQQPTQRMNPPASFPTLTPWFGDNFGK